MRRDRDTKAGTVKSWRDSAGVTAWSIWCGCGHRADLPMERFADATPMEAIRRRLTCSACGADRVDFRPIFPPAPGTPEYAAARRLSEAEMADQPAGDGSPDLR